MVFSYLEIEARAGSDGSDGSSASNLVLRALFDVGEAP